MRDIDLFAKNALETAVRIGIPTGMGGVADAVAKPEFAAAVGLAMIAAEDGQNSVDLDKKSKKSTKDGKKFDFVKKFFAKF